MARCKGCPPPNVLAKEEPACSCLNPMTFTDRLVTLASSFFRVGVGVSGGVVILGLLGVGGGGVAGCAAGRPGVSPNSDMRQSAEGPEPTTVEEAQADIARWRQVLIPGSSSTTTSVSAGHAPDHPAAPAGAPATAPMPAPAPASESATSSREHAPSKTAESADDGRGAGGKMSSQCATPCRAISSMRRSVTALCRLSGEEDARCVDARKTLTESEERVVSCGC